MQLYERVMKGKRTTYVPYVPPEPPDPRDYEIPQEQVVTLLSTLVMSMLLSVENQLPNHARVAREIQNVESAVVRLAKLNAKPLDEDLVNAGVAAWNAAMNSMQENLLGGGTR